MMGTPLRDAASANPTPAWLYPVGIIVAILIGSAAADPKILLALIIVIIVAVLLIAGARNPWIGLCIIIAQYPVINTLRTIYTAHHLPVFAGGVRFLPDFLQLVIIAQLMICAIRDRRLRLKIFPDDIPIVVYILVGIYSRGCRATTYPSLWGDERLVLIHNSGYILFGHSMAPAYKCARYALFELDGALLLYCTRTLALRIYHAPGMVHSSATRRAWILRSRWHG